MAVDIEELEPGTNENYVNEKCDRILAKQFMSIDTQNGQFMLPVRKVGGVQQYMRMTLVSVDGVWSVDLDQKFYVKNEDETYSEVNA